MHKHPGILLYDKLSYEHHLKFVLNKVKKRTGLLRKFQQILSRQSLITIYKLFIRPHLDYGDIIYHRVFNKSFHKNLESIQYNAAIAITGAIRGTSSGELFQELGLESLVLVKNMFILHNFSSKIFLVPFSADLTKQ